MSEDAIFRLILTIVYELCGLSFSGYYSEPVIVVYLDVSLRAMRLTALIGQGISSLVRSMTVTSGGERKRIGGPHVPAPLLT